MLSPSHVEIRVEKDVGRVSRALCIWVAVLKVGIYAAGNECEDLLDLSPYPDLSVSEISRLRDVTS